MTMFQRLPRLQKYVFMTLVLATFAIGLNPPTTSGSDAASTKPATQNREVAEAWLQYENGISQAKADYDKRVEVAKRAYLAKLKGLMAAETRKGNLDDALAIRAEMQKVGDVATDEGNVAKPGTSPDRVGAGASRQAVHIAPIRSRKKLLEDAKDKLSPEQFAIAQGLLFSNFKGHKDRSYTGGYCNLEMDNQSPVGVIDRDLTASVEYLCVDGNQKRKVLKYTGNIGVVRKGRQEANVSGSPPSATIEKNNRGDWKPVDAHIIVSYFGVPIFEAKQDPKILDEWWDDSSIVVQ